MDAEQLLRHGPFLRSLARRLVTDEATVDDVVQEAWTAALESRRRIRTPRAWLAGAVRRFTRFRSRSDVRRRRREHAVAAPERQRGTADVVATEETRQRVVHAVLALDEPYRTVILMRYYDGLAPREIAKRLGIEPSTVRTRLQRGHARLRACLAERDRRWARALVPLAVGPAASTGLWLGAAAALLVVAAGWIGWATLDERAPARARQTERAAHASVETTRRDAGPAVASLAADDDAAQGGAGAEDAVRLVAFPPADGARERTPTFADNTLVAIFLLRDGRPLDEAETNARADVSGEVDLPKVNDGAYLVVAVSPGHRPVAWRAHTRGGRVALRDVELDAGLTIAGRVTDPAGQPIAGANVGVRRARYAGRALSVPGRDERFGWDGAEVTLLGTHTRTARDGTFSVSGLDDALYEVWVEQVPDAHGSVTARDGWLYAAEARAPTSDMAFRVARARVELEIVDASGHPVTDTEVRIGQPGGMETHGCGEGRFGLWFRPGTRHRITVAKTGFHDAEVPVTAPAAGGEETHRIELRPKRDTATLVVSIRGVPDELLPESYGFRLEPKAGGEPATRAVDVVDGKFVLAKLDPGAYRVYARAHGLWLPSGGYVETLEVDVDLAPARETAIELRPRPAGRLILEVVSRDGNTDTPLKIEAEGPRGERIRWRFCKGDGSGYVTSAGKLPEAKGPAYVTEPILPGVYRLRFTHDDGTTFEREVEIVAGQRTRAKITWP